MHIPPHILILEDDEEIAMLEQDYLENAGYTSDVISDGTLAVGAILSGRYDLILLDVMLPGQNGYDICLDVRSRTNLPILMVTALDDSTDKIRGLGLGAMIISRSPLTRQSWSPESALNWRSTSV